MWNAGMRNSAQGVWNPAKDFNPESIPLTKDPGSIALDPESNTVLCYVTWGEDFVAKKLRNGAN